MSVLTFLYKKKISPKIGNGIRGNSREIRFNDMTYVELSKLSVSALRYLLYQPLYARQQFKGCGCAAHELGRE